MLLLSQLNRAGERSHNKVPKLSDLRDSGSIEQNADSILSPYREAYYFAREEPDEADHVSHDDWKQIMEKVAEKSGAYVAKNRYGPTMNITLRWEGKTMSYQDPLRAGRRDS